MIGCRPLSAGDLAAIDCALGDAEHAGDTLAPRTRALVHLGTATGGRVSELLALLIRDAYDVSASPPAPLPLIYYRRAVVKGRTRGRGVPVTRPLRDALAEYLPWRWRLAGWPVPLPGDLYLLPSARSGGQWDRVSAWRALRAAYRAAGVAGSVATHSLRKPLAQSLQDAGAPVRAIQEQLGHAHVSTTERYLGWDPRRMAEWHEKAAGIRAGADGEKREFLGSVGGA